MTIPKSTTKIYIILLVVFPLLLGLIFFIGALLLVNSLSEPSNPQDPTGWLYLFTPVVAGVGIVFGLVIGITTSLIIYLLNRSKKTS